MHVALIVDDERLLHEHIMLNRMSIGLIDEGVLVTRLVPETTDSEVVMAGEQRISLATRLTYPANVPPWMHRIRASRLAGQMGKAIPDILYAIGDRAWPVALDLAAVLSRPVALDFWKAEQVRKAPTGRTARHVAAYISPTQPIADDLRDRVDPNLVSLVPMGVAMPGNPTTIMANPQGSLTMAILGSARDVPAYTAVLRGLSTVVRDVPQLQVFLELRGRKEHEIWRVAQQLELLGQLTAISDASQHRRLLLCCDVLAWPECYGEVRSLQLDAMAAARAVIARADSGLDLLRHDQTAAVVESDRAESWTRQLQRILKQPDHARQLGESARSFVATRHTSTQQVASLIDTFEKILSGGALSFSASGV